MSERLAVARMGRHGDGICEAPSGPLYVAYALPGETIEVAPWPGHPDRRHLREIVTASPERVAPICPHFGLCGGCALQHWDLARYRDWKRRLVGEALAQVGIDAPIDTLIDAHGEGRRRAVFHARRGTSRDLLEVGFAARKAHHVVSIDRCPVLAPGLKHAIPAARAIAEELAALRKPLDIQITATEAGLDVDLRGSGPLAALHVAALGAIADLHRIARLTRHGEMIAQRVQPTLRIGRALLVPPPGAFLQPTAAGEGALAQLVGSFCAGATMIADLFCGIGPFALRLAERARVSAADSDAAALSALRQAVESSPGLKPVATILRDLFRRPLDLNELGGFDAVVFDPPRQGAQAQATALAASRVPRVVAVSCNPFTFARDARILLDGGYRLERVTPVDQFLYSSHVEVVALFQRTAS